MKLTNDDVKTYDNEVVVPKFNIAGLNVTEVENAIEYLMFVDFGEGMESYTHLRPLVEALARLTVSQADKAVGLYQDRIVRDIADKLKGEVSEVVYGTKIPTSEQVTVHTTIDDEKVLKGPLEGEDESTEKEIPEW